MSDNVSGREVDSPDRQRTCIPCVALPRISTDDSRPNLTLTQPNRSTGMLAPDCQLGTPDSANRKQQRRQQSATEAQTTIRTSHGNAHGSEVIVDQELVALRERLGPEHCRTLTVSAGPGGVVKELIFPRALDLDRPKRARTNFTDEQLRILEDNFQRDQYLVGRDRLALANQLGLTETQVKVWYQNRRTKHKRGQGDSDDDLCDYGVVGAANSDPENEPDAVDMSTQASVLSPTVKKRPSSGLDANNNITNNAAHADQCSLLPPSFMFGLSNDIDDPGDRAVLRSLISGAGAELGSSNREIVRESTKDECFQARLAVIVNEAQLQTDEQKAEQFRDIMIEMQAAVSRSS